MSQFPSRPTYRHLLELVALAVCLGLGLGVTRVEPFGEVRFNVILAIGYLSLSGTLLASVLEPLKLPHLTAYIAVGILGGPHVLGLVDTQTVTSLVPVNTLAISLIALAGGLELEASLLRKLLRSLFWSNLVQSLVVGLVSLLAFVLLAEHIPFAAHLPLGGLLAVAAIWGMLASSRSPSATLAILSQTRAKGPFASWSLAIVMSSDLVVVVLSAVLLAAARPLLLPDAHWSLERFYVLGREILGSVALGVCLGLLLAAYLRLVGRQLVLILLVLGFVVTDGLKYVHFDPLLAFLVTGFVVRNLSRQAERLLAAVSRMSGVVFVVFFATAGAHLDLPLLQTLWPIALAFCVTRAIATVGANAISARLARDESSVRRYGWTPLISQAGLTLALAQTVERELPTLGTGFRSLVIASVAFNEVIGPILFKWALERTHETVQMASTRPVLGPPPREPTAAPD